MNTEKLVSLNNKEKLGWGFLGAGSIANRFINGLEQVPDAYLAAVSSRNFEKAKDFAAKHGGTAYKEFEQVILDENVDIIYVATPHTLHAENTILALEMGKPVLCEKPAAPNAAMVKEMVSKAREKGVYLMEAMWTRFFPAVRKAVNWINEGKIGKVNLVAADFGFAAKEDPSSRLFNPDLAGGSLLDVGIYPISFASMIYGRRPAVISSAAEMASTGVDACMSCSIKYNGGGIASLVSAINANTPQDARIMGDYGEIVIPHFWSPRNAILYQNRRIVEEFSVDFKGEGFQFEIAAVQEDIRAGRLENQLMPLDETIAIAEIMDEIRAQWGLVYPFENSSYA